MTDIYSGTRLNEQTAGPTPLKNALIGQLNLCMFDFNVFTLWSWISPVRFFTIRKHNRVMRNFILPHIWSRLSGTPSKHDKDANLTTIIDLALKEAHNESMIEGGPPITQDQKFIDTVISNIKIFLFAGHDTTAVAICWVLHSLAKNPIAMAKLRAEHDAVLGPDPSSAAQRLREAPWLLNSLNFTLACIKESLRLHPGPPVIRVGGPNVVFKVPSSPIHYPTDGFMMWDALRAYMRWDEAWPRATEFLPERWTTTDPNSPLRPQKNTWRVFGLGPRNCIGQELAMAEIKIVLALTVREVDMDCAWDDWGLTKCEPSPFPLPPPLPFLS